MHAMDLGGEILDPGQVADRGDELVGDHTCALLAGVQVDLGFLEPVLHVVGDGVAVEELDRNEVAHGVGVGPLHGLLRVVRLALPVTDQARPVAHDKAG